MRSLAMDLEGMMIGRRKVIGLAAAFGGVALAGPVMAAQTTRAALPPNLPLAVETLGSAEAPLAGLSIAPDLYPVEVSVNRDFVPGTIIILSSKHYLYFITRPGKAIRYGVAVGKEGLTFRGRAEIGRKVEWPSWKPTPEMVERNPKAYAKYAENGMEGGPKNPLGARGIYLYRDGRDTAVRIHGTTEPNSIGKSVSNGCIRMVNAHVEDLYQRVQMGAEVIGY
jgi:lipoprotein-anchoring transpeptidase ErfK/SrfK